MRGRKTSNIQHPTPNAQRWTAEHLSLVPAPGRVGSPLRCWMFDVGCSMFPLQKILAALSLFAGSLLLHAQLLPSPLGNVLLYDADPFVIESAALLGGFNVPDWASAPTGLPGALSVTGERAGANGLGTPTPVPLAPLPLGAAFALPNQLAPDIAVFNYSGRAGLPGDDCPVITGQPVGQSRQPGETAVFTVTAVGAGVLRYQWFKNDQAMADGGNISGTQTATLTIGPVKVGDAGQYFVRVSNACGTTPSSAAILALSAKLQAVVSASTLTLSWTALNVVLEQADSIIGPWTPVPGATSPFSPTALGSTKFFRLATGP